MAHHQLHHAEESQELFSKATTWLDTYQRTLPWDERLKLQLLGREAGKLLQQPSPAKDQKRETKQEQE
jgi:hypothetical protein